MGVLGVAAGRADRHGLDKAQGEVMLNAELHHVSELVIIDPLHCNRIDLDWGEAGLLGGHQSIDHLAAGSRLFCQMDP